MAKGKAVVVGGLGMIGRNIIQALEAEGGWEIVGLSRRPANFETNATFISVDLLDEAQAREKLAGLTDVTHIFYAGLSGGVEAENVEGNLALVVNSVGVIEPISPTLERVILVQAASTTASTSARTRHRRRRPTRATCRPTSITTSRTSSPRCTRGSPGTTPC